MHRRLIYTVLALALAATAQDRTTVNQGSSTPSTAPAFSGGSRQTHAPGAVVLVNPQTGLGDAIDFRAQQHNNDFFRPRVDLRISGSHGGRFFNTGCWRGYCGGGYFYNPYMYAMPVYIESNNGPDFNARPSAYSVYSGEVPKEYMAPGAAAVDAAYRQGQLEQRISSLAEEVARLRAEKEVREAVARELAAREGRLREPGSADRSFADANLASSADAAHGPSSAATATIVFKNGSKLDIANYAVVGRTLWVFDEQRARKILLSDLDLEATHRANAASGYETRIPAR